MNSNPGIGIDHPAVGKQIDANGILTNYHDMGSGYPVIFLHGSGAGVTGYENWHGVMPLLADGFRTIAPDIVGFGLTQRPEGAQYNIKLWVNHLLGFMDALDIEQAVLVGNSFGGALALATAMRNAHRVSRMVLMGTPAGEFTRGENAGSSWHYEPSLDNMAELLRAFPYDPKWVTPEMVKQRYEMTLHAGGMEAYRKLFPEPAPGVVRTVRGIPEESLKQIDTPTLVLHGRQDRMVPAVCGERIAEHCGNADLHVFGKCGHWVQIERQREFVDLTRSFLHGLGQA